MATAATPFDVALLPSTDKALWVYGLVRVPPVPVSLADALAAAAPMPPALFAYTAQPVPLLPDSLVVISGTAELQYPPGTSPLPAIVGLALVAFQPPTILLAAAAAAQPLVFKATSERLEVSMSITVARPPVLNE